MLTPTLFSLPVFYLAGFLLDAVFGDPDYPFHPVRLLGRCISGIETALRRVRLNGRFGGILLAVLVTGIGVGSYLLLSGGLNAVHPRLGWVFDVYVFFSCLALKDLFDHIRPVVRSLKAGNIHDARLHVSKIVGRDVDHLTVSDINRAVIETLSENFVDGFLNPVFWFLAGAVLAMALALEPVVMGLCLMLAAKAASTLDSMVGYKNHRYRQFGWAGARFDDAMVFVPARISIAVLFLGARIGGMDALSGFRMAARDRLNHDSPNAGHPESFDGALHIKLGGPISYGGRLKPKQWFGGEYPEPRIDDILAAQKLIQLSAWSFMLVSEGLLIVLTTGSTP